MAAHDRFVRMPTVLLEAMLLSNLTGVQTRILLWVIRHTYGWNRQETSFSWYRIAKELTLDQGGVVRAGNTLLHAKVLRANRGRLGIQEDYEQWGFLVSTSDRAGQLHLPGVSADKHHRKPMTARIASDDDANRNRCQESSLFRRAKDSSKDRLKTYKDRSHSDAARHRWSPDNTQRPLLAGAARPIPGKYDGISQD
jgi:phage replication O-like protein O